MSDGRIDGTGTSAGGAGGAGLRGAAVVAGAIGLAAGALATTAVVNAPRIRQWWTAQALPSVQAVGRRVLGRDELPEEAPADASVILTRSTLRGFTRRVDSAFAPGRDVSRTPEFVDLLLAASIIADRMRTRSDADTEAEAHEPRVSAAMARLASPWVVDAVNRTLASNAAHVDDETRTIFVRVFDGGHVGASGYVPVTLDRVAGALRITRTAIPVPHRAEGGGATA